MDYCTIWDGRVHHYDVVTYTLARCSLRPLWSGDSWTALFTWSSLSSLLSISTCLALQEGRRREGREEEGGGERRREEEGRGRGRKREEERGGGRRREEEGRGKIEDIGHEVHSQIS